MENGIGHWLLEYATRQQMWLRREVHQLSKKVKVVTPCTVILVHLSRNDIVLHSEHSRRYREVSEYVKALDNNTKNTLLSTDDLNAMGKR